MQCKGCGHVDYETLDPLDDVDPVIQCRNCHRIYALRYAWVELEAADTGKVIPLRRR